jgi:hypothetical protein
VNTSNPAQLQQMQQQYVSQIPQATPQQQTTTAPTSNDTSPEGINEMVKQFSREADYWVADANARKAQEDQLKQQQQQVQTPTAQVAQTQVQPTTVQPATGTTTQTPVASNPQVATTTQPQQTKPPTVGSSDGQGNILMSNPQTGKLEWRRQEDVLAMYQNGSNENRGKVQLPDGSWVDKSTAESAVAKLEGILEARKLADSGVINEEQLKRLVGDQDLIGILGPSVESRNKKARERMKAAVDGGASGTSLADVGGNANPYSGFTPSAGGGEAS